MSFRTILETARQKNGSALAIGLAPRLDKLPLPIQRYDDPFLPYGRAIIEATSDLVSAYVFHLGAYLALGAAGAIALERTIAAVPMHLVKILHAPFATADFVRASFEDAFGADAVTLAPTTDVEMIAPYVRDSYHGVFVHAPPGFDSTPLLALNTDYPGQVGVYKAAGEAYNTVGVLFPSYPTLHWRWGEAVYPSRGDDYQDAIRAAVRQLKLAEV
jgi:hypothetical protein